MSNLWREAEARGVASERVVFAPRMAQSAAHLARLRLADLFLDTRPYNAMPPRSMRSGPGSRS